MGTKRTSNLVFGLAEGEGEFIKGVVEVRGEPPSLKKSILNILNGPNQSIERLAFEENPRDAVSIARLWQPKIRAVPDDVLKRIAIQDSLVSNIVRARQNHVSQFGRPRPDRFSTGYVIKPNTGIVDQLDEAGKKKLNERIERAVKLLSTCGHTEGLTDDHQATFAEYLKLSARSAVTVGRIATEVVWVDDDENPGEKKFHHFVATDAGTIYRATNDVTGLQALRRQAYHTLKQVTGKDLEPERKEPTEFAWVQVIEGKEEAAFTSDEMKCYNFYAVPDVEMKGYPVTPIDTVISAVTTHINITTHNRLYFQSGRASRGMLVIKSDDAGPHVISQLKQQFNASINSVNNSWRMPVFGCGTDEEITWQPIDSGGGKDMEFQYLTDMNAREILTAFMMSPDELPGWSYLSRGTNNQALSESNNEYKLQAARDVGIRPLLADFEDFINGHLLPLIDPELAKMAQVKLVGLESDNPEKEAVRTQQDMGIWMTYDDVLERVEKKPLGAQWGGTVPLNPAIQAVWDKYLTVGQILEKFFGVQGAAQDPSLAYRRDPFWFQWVELQQQAQMAQQQAAAAQQGGPPGGGDGGGDGPPQDGGGDGGGDGGKGPGAPGGDAPTEKQKTAQVQEASAAGQANDLARSIDAAFQFLTKGEAQLPAAKRRVLAQHQRTVDHFMKGFLDDMKDATAEILQVARHHAPKPRA